MLFNRSLMKMMTNMDFDGSYLRRLPVTQTYYIAMSMYFMLVYYINFWVLKRVGEERTHRV